GCAPRAVHRVFKTITGGGPDAFNGGFHLLPDPGDVQVADIGNPAQQLFHVVEELLQFGRPAPQAFATPLAGDMCHIGQMVCGFWHAQIFRLRPSRKVANATTRNTTNRIFAIPAAPAGIPENPRTAAISAMTKKTTA